MTLKKLAKVLSDEFGDCRARLPEGFMSVEYRPSQGKNEATLSITIGNRDIEIDGRGNVVGAGSGLYPLFKVTPVRYKKVGA